MQEACRSLWFCLIGFGEQVAARSPVFRLPRNDEKHSEFSKVTSGPYPGVIVIELSALSSVRVELFSHGGFKGTSAANPFTNDFYLIFYELECLL